MQKNEVNYHLKNASNGEHIDKSKNNDLNKIEDQENLNLLELDNSKFINKNSKITSCDNQIKNNILNDNIIKNNEKSTLDIYLDSSGYNRFQITTILIVSYVFFVDGSEMVIINLILSSIQRDWKITKFERSLLSSAVFFGFFFGSFVSGYLTNKYGRKKPAVFGVILIWIFTTFTPYTNTFFNLFTLRLHIGIGIGFVVPSLTSLITELIPTFYRSFVLNILWIFYPFGIIYICLVSLFHIKEKEFLDWKKITKINSYSSILMVLLCLMLCESPRYLLLKRKYSEAFRILDSLGKSSKKLLSEEEKEKIIIESQLLEEENKNKGNFDLRVFKEQKFLKVSLLLSFLWFISSLISYGLLYILPKLFDNLSRHDKVNSLLHMIYSMIILTFCPFFRGIISEIKSIGRKNSMIIGFTGAGIACLFCIANETYISVSSGLLKFFINTSLGIISVYTSEIYPTNVRGVALGFGNSITRLGGILTPFICESVESLISKGPFWLFIFGSLSGIIACMALPYETMGMMLDKIPTKEKNNDKIDKAYNLDEKRKLDI